MIKLRFSQTGVDSDFSQNFCVKIRWVEALFLCYLTLFTQASMNLRNGHNVTQVDFDSYRSDHYSRSSQFKRQSPQKSLKPANGYAQVKETFGSSVQDAKARLTIASQKI